MKSNPEPADPDYWEHRAGDLGIGTWSYQVLRERPVKLKPKKYPFGFRLPSE